MQNEIWRDIPEYNGEYQVSNLGRVRHITISILKGDVGDYGKTRYQITDENGRKKHMGHILVAKAFPEICGEWYQGCNVHHKDGNPKNNNADNLICITPQEHQVLHNKRKRIVQTDLDGRIIRYWDTATQAAQTLGYQQSAISQCCTKKQHTAYGYRWEYA